MIQGTIGTAFHPDKHREAIAKANQKFMSKMPFRI